MLQIQFDMKQAKTLLLALSLLFLGCEKEKFVPRITPNVNKPVVDNYISIEFIPSNTIITISSGFSKNITLKITNSSNVKYFYGESTFYFSTDSIYSDNDKLVNIDKINIEPNDNDYSTFLLNLPDPTTPNTYYVIAIVKNNDPNSNIISKVQQISVVDFATYSGLQVSLTGLNISNSTQPLNDFELSVSLKYYNPKVLSEIQTYPYYNLYIDYYLSIDNQFSASDFRIGTSRSDFNANGNGSIDTYIYQDVKNNDTIAAGDYYVIARLNSGNTNKPIYTYTSTNNKINFYRQGTISFIRTSESNTNRYIYIDGKNAGYIYSYYQSGYDLCTRNYFDSYGRFVKLSKSPGTYTYSITDSSTPGFGTTYQSGSFTVTNMSCEIINITL